MPFSLQSVPGTRLQRTAHPRKSRGRKGEVSFQNFSHLLVCKDWVSQTLLLLPESQRDLEFSHPKSGCKPLQECTRTRHPAAPGGLFIIILNKTESSPNTFNKQIKNLPYHDFTKYHSPHPTPPHTAGLKWVFWTSLGASRLCPPGSLCPRVPACCP